MLPASYRQYEVVRVPNLDVITEINVAIHGLVRDFVGNPNFNDIRPANSKGYLTLLGMYKMDFASRKAAANSELLRDSGKTFAAISRELIAAYSNPLELPITSFTIHAERNRDLGEQAVLFANLGSNSSAEEIGQIHASKRLREASGHYDMRPYAQRIPLLFTNKLILYGGVEAIQEARSDMYNAAKDALSTIGNIPYSGATWPSR